jgi:sulfate adenylyltransferase
VAGSIPLPHGNKLIDRFVVSDKKNMQDMYTLQVSNELRNDIENIADGIFSPLEGFVGEGDFQSIVKRGRLSNGLAWTIPLMNKKHTK